MKKQILCIVLTLMLSACLTFGATTAFADDVQPNSTDIAINKTNFPDENFMREVKYYDLNSDNVLQVDELNACTVMDLQWKMIGNLTGIQYFTQLKELNCSGNNLSQLDLRRNTLLETLDCSGNWIESLNLSKNSLLQNLNCSVNELTTLNLTDNRELKELNCNWNKITGLDLSANGKLNLLWCKGNRISDLDISSNGELKELNCQGNEISKLTVVDHPAIETLFCSDNEMTDMDVRNDAALEELNCDHNNLTSLSLENLPALRHLNCSANPLGKLDVSEFSLLEGLYCFENGLSSLNVSNNSMLKFLDCSNNRIVSLNTANNTGLKTLYCYKNRITSLNVKNNLELDELMCFGNRLTSLDLSSNKGLIYFDENIGTTNPAKIGEQQYSIKVSCNGKIDLRKLDGFDVSKITRISGGTLKGSTLTFNSGSNRISYYYSTGIKQYGYTYMTVELVTDSSNLKHSYSDKWTVDKKASTTTDGSRSRHCTGENCTAKTDIKTIPKVSGIRLYRNEYVYDGNVKTPGVYVLNRNGNAIPKTAYTIERESGRKKVGKYCYKVRLNSSYYSGTKTLYLTIKPRPTEILGIYSRDNGFKVKWSKRTIQNTGYQVRYSSKSDFSRSYTIPVDNSYRNYLTKYKLKSKTKYYVKVRTYKVVDGVKYYSSWSKAKSVVTG